MSVIETRELFKSYGKIEALKGVTIRVEKGQIYGLLGQNGAGKTTLIKILLGIVRKTDGDASLLGHAAGDPGARKRVGYLPEDHAFPVYHTGYSLMDFYGQLYGMSRDDRRRMIPEMLELVGIAGRMNSKIRTYSKGMKQRLGIAQALFHDPQVIFLDEPTDGVDPVGRREIRELMERLKGEGKTLFLNSHLLGEVELVCDRVAILQRGELVREGTVSDLTRQVGLFVIGLAPGQEFPTNEVNRLGYPATATPAGGLFEVGLPEGKTIDPVLNLLAEKRLSLRHLVEKKQSLEDLFVSIVDAAEPGTDGRPARGAESGRRHPAEGMSVQFVAFLRDSYREARNGWMLQIMLALSSILVLLVASIGYRPITLEDTLAQPFKTMKWAMSLNPQAFEQMGKPEATVENFVSTNAAEPWRADYTFDYVVRVPQGEDIRKARRSPFPVGKERVQQFLRQVLSQTYETVEVTGGLPQLDVPPSKAAKGDEDDEDAPKKKVDPKDEGPPPPPESRYQVTVRGSKVDDPLAWPHQVSALFAFDLPGFHIPLRQGVYLTENYLVSGIGSWIALLVAVIITAGFIPTMLAKGSLDLIVSKPIGRTRLLVYKYLGGLTFILVLTTFTVVGVWLAIGLRSGLWSPNFLLVIPLLTFYFAVLYGVSTLAAVLTRSTIVAILATGLAWVMLWGIGKVNNGIENRRAAEVADVGGGLPKGPEDVARRIDPDGPLWFIIPKWSFTAFTTLHAVSPRTYQLDDRLGRAIAEGVLTPNQLKAEKLDVQPRESWAELIGVSAVFIVVVIGLAAWRFSTRDY